MPNAQQYLDAAARYRNLADQFLSQAARAGGWPVASHVAGAVADVVAEALDRSAARLADAAGEMTRLARICETRAVVCDEYRRRVQQDDLLDRIIHLVVSPPAPPYPWVSL